LLVIATEPNEKMLLDIIDYQLRSLDFKGDDIDVLMKMIPAHTVPINTRLKIIRFLIKKNQIELGEDLLGSININNFFQQTVNYNQAKTIFFTLIDIGRSDYIQQIFEEGMPAGLFSDDEINKLKIDVVNRLILKGHQYAARKILMSINEKTLTDNEFIAKLCFGYIRLSMFEQAKNILQLIDNKGEWTQMISAYKALYHVSIGAIDEAAVLINCHNDDNNKQHMNLTWKIKILNYSGLYAYALQCADNLLSRTNLPLTYKCIALIEKGNAFRTFKSYDIAEKFYRDAQNTKLDTALWLWIAHFEHAMMKIFLGDILEAFRVTLNGCECQCDLHNKKYNPCNVLNQFTAFLMDKRGGVVSTSPKKWITDIDLWPFPFLPHKTWMLMLLAIAFEAIGEQKAVKYLIKNLLTNVEIANGDRWAGLLEGNGELNTGEIVNYLSLKYYPNDFNWLVIKKLSKGNEI